MSNKKKKLLHIAIAFVCIILSIVLVLTITTVIVPKSKYNSATKAYEKGDYSKAYELYSQILDYKDSAQKTRDSFSKMDTSAEVGESVFFGEYEQDGEKKNGKEPIEWIVVKKENDKILVVSKYILDFKKFNEEKKSISWSDSSIRKWLNNDFYNSTFSNAEKEKILKRECVTGKNKEYATKGCKDTQDYVILLSQSQFDDYMVGNEKAEMTDAAYQKRKGLFRREYYWLRNNGDSKKKAIFVTTFGKQCYTGFAVDTSRGIRPAVWITVK